MRYSYWKLFKLYNKCPYSYYLAVVLGKKSDVSDVPEHEYVTVRGTIFHELMERRTKNKWSWVQTVDQLSVCIEEGDNKGYKLILQKELEGCLLRMRTSSLRPYFDNIEYAERTISKVVNGRKLAGRVDSQGVLHDRRFRIDWKVSNSASGDGSRQLAFYNLIEPVEEGCVYYPMLDVGKFARLTDKRCAMLADKVAELVSKIEVGLFDKNYKACGYCYYLSSCKRK